MTLTVMEVSTQFYLCFSILQPYFIKQKSSFCYINGVEHYFLYSTISHLFCYYFSLKKILKIPFIYFYAECLSLCCYYFSNLTHFFVFCFWLSMLVVQVSFYDVNWIMVLCQTFQLVWKVFCTVGELNRFAVLLRLSFVMPLCLISLQKQLRSFCQKNNISTPLSII